MRIKIEGTIMDRSNKLKVSEPTIAAKQTGTAIGGCWRMHCFSQPYR